MFKKTKRRVRVVIMSVFLVIWVATLIIIYTSTETKIQKENKEMMQIYADTYSTHGLPRTGPSPDLPDISEDASSDGKKPLKKKRIDDFKDNLTHRYELSTFLAVIFDESGEVKEFSNQKNSDFSDEELQAFAKKLLGKKEYGKSGNMVYLISKGEDYTMVTMMDVTVIESAIDTLLTYMLFFGGISVVVMFVLSALLASWVVVPLKSGYEKQQQFISNAGHELKTPISTIDANAALLQREVGENSWLSNIVYENNRMSVIVKELLDLAKLDQAKIPLQEVDLSQTALASILPFEAKAYEEGYELEYQIQDTIHMKGYPDQLEKLISILLDNALNHASKNGKIQVVLASEKNTITISVSNPGKEIPEEDREKIFERFYRIDESRTGGNHYGLGLSIAKSIVNNHKGSIQVICKNGITCFQVTFKK